MKRLISLAFVLLTAVLPAHAGTDIWLTGGGSSKHFKESDRFNERNGGIGLEVHTSKEVAFIGGTFTNSVNERTEYLGATWQPLQYGIFKFGAAGGVMNGYPKHNNGGAFPVILPMASVEYKRVGMNMMIIPNFRGSPGAFTFQFKLKLN